MRASVVADVLIALGIYQKSNPLGFVLPGNRHRLECGGGIAGNTGRWSIVDIRSGNIVDGPFTDERDLTEALRRWKAGGDPPRETTDGEGRCIHCGVSVVDGAVCSCYDGMLAEIAALRAALAQSEDARRKAEEESNRLAAIVEQDHIDMTNAIEVSQQQQRDLDTARAELEAVRRERDKALGFPEECRKLGHTQKPGGFCVNCKPWWAKVSTVETDVRKLRALARRLLEQRAPQPFFGGWKCWSCGNRGVSETTIPHLDGCDYAAARALGVFECDVDREAATATLARIEAAMEATKPAALSPPPSPSLSEPCTVQASSNSAQTPSATLRPEVLAFAQAMEAKLRENDHKGGWKNDDPRALLRRLREETDELDPAVTAYEARRRERPGDDDHVAEASRRVLREAADVANFAMMIADVCGALSVSPSATREGEAKADRACGNADCKVSTGICDSLTFGRGDLDDNGYWEIPCGPCAREHERRHPDDGPCWPFAAPPPREPAGGKDGGQ